MRFKNPFIVGFMVVLLLAVSFLGSNLEAQTSNVTVSLSWNANTESDLAGYKVYRGQGTAQCSGTAPLPALTANGTPVKVLAPSITYTDATVARVEGPVCYELTAYDTSSNESGRSNRAQVVLNVNPPSSPQNLQVVIP